MIDSSRSARQNDTIFSRTCGRAASGGKPVPCRTTLGGGMHTGRHQKPIFMLHNDRRFQEGEHTCMKKKASLLLAIAMLISMLTVPVNAEEAYVAPHPDIIWVEGTDTQAALSSTTKNIIEVDGLKFKDLNRNGKLDMYEDWRADDEDRITDLLSQLTLEEKVMLLFHTCLAGNMGGGGLQMTEQELFEQNCPFETSNTSSTGFSVWYYVNVYGLTHMLDNSNGTPAEKVQLHNIIQEMCESTRMGIPMTFSSDRQNNGWAGLTDAPHDAFGTANDPELAQELWSIYGDVMKAIGYHVIFHPYGLELGSWNGEDPEYLAKMTDLEVRTIVNSGLEACTKHWIARGGDSSFTNARSVAQTVDNWMVPWQAGIDAGSNWVMTNTAAGLTNTVRVDYEKETLQYLREELDFKGIVLTDWRQMIDFAGDTMTPDGVDLSVMTLEQLYTRMLECGVNQFGCQTVVPGNDPSIQLSMTGYPDALLNAVNGGICDVSLVDASARRVLRSKFALGLFENPYADEDAWKALDVSEEYLANPWEITDADSLAAARDPHVVALERQLQAESTVLVKNDNQLLPLKKGTKVYFSSSNSALNKSYAAELAKHTTVVDAIDDADVVIADISAIDDAAELAVDDAKLAGKPLVLTMNCVDPNTWAMENADAILFLNYKFQPDHGTAIDGFTFRMEACVYADLIFGEREPEGMIVKEIARSTDLDFLQWKDLAGDQGASDWVRLMLLATMKENPEKAVPNNWGDPLLCYEFGMHYGVTSDFEYDTLVVPQTNETYTYMGTRGPSPTLYEMVGNRLVNTVAQVGEPYTVSFLLWNHGGDDVLTVKAYDGDEVIAEKIMAVNGSSWRVVEMELVFDTAGEHVITIGDMSTTIVAE